MSWFYQSPLWTTINQQVYQKPSFTCSFAGQTYTGYTKRKRLMGKQFQRYMVHGCTLSTYDTYSDELHQLLGQLKRDYGKWFGDLFFQLGIVNEFDVRPTAQVKEQAVRTALLQQRQDIQTHLKTWYDLVPSWREHMPQATLTLDLTRSLHELTQDLSDSGKRYINKGKKAELEFVQATDADWEVFWNVRYTTAYDKGFAVVPKEQFLRLKDFLKSEQQGDLFLLKHGQDVVSGSVCLFRDKTLIYLYGATARAYGDIGAHYRLNRQIMERAKAQHFTTYDLLWVSPVGEEQTHALWWVTRFKQAFGGTTISYVGNMDILLNSMMYKAYKMWKK
jgi:lipid II:glycine glycyltransferase (peptidoglycan interpeptide bridge formation enzyme)